MTSCNTPCWSTADCSGSNAGVEQGGRRPGVGDPAQRAWVAGCRDAGPGLSTGKVNPTRPSSSSLGRSPCNPDLAALYRARADVDLGRKEQTPSQRERALRDLETAIRLEPPGSPFLSIDQTNRAQLLHREGREDEALAACEAALEVDPNFLEAHRLRIDVLRKLKRHSEVIRSCDALLTRGKPSAELYELRALAKQDLNDYQGAIEDDTLAIAMRPRSAVAPGTTGWALPDHRRATARRCVTLRSRSVSIHRALDSADAYLGRGLARASLGLHREAVADASRAVRLGEPTDKRLYNAARIYAKAAIAATAEVKKTGQDAVGLVFALSGSGGRAAATGRDAALRPRSGRLSCAMWFRPTLRWPTLRHRLRSLDLAGSALKSDRSELQPQD